MIDLWLDDERDPNHPEIQELFNAFPGMLWVRTAEAAIAKLRTGQVRFLSLDHDLGTVLTGYDVARWIEERAFNGDLARCRWAVHSMNVEGARRIRAALCRADQFWIARENALPDNNRSSDSGPGV